MDDGENEQKVPHAPCSGLRKELKECILASDCVRKVIYECAWKILL